jgi:hypothetical protein
MKNKTEKRMVDKMREIRDNISNDIKDLSFDELTKYLENRKALHPKFKKRKVEKV